MKVTCETKSDCGSYAVYLILTLEGKAPAYSLNKSGAFGGLCISDLRCRSASSSQEVWKLTIDRQAYADHAILAKIDSIMEKILKDNDKLCKEYPAFSYATIKSI